MKLSEEQIKNILQHTQTEIKPDLNFEASIMSQINDIETDSHVIQKSKQRARIGLVISLVAAVSLTLSILYNILNHTDQQLLGLEGILPSLMVIMMLLTLNQLLYFSISLQKGS